MRITTRSKGLGTSASSRISRRTDVREPSKQSSSDRPGEGRNGENNFSEAAPYPPGRSKSVKAYRPCPECGSFELTVRRSHGFFGWLKPMLGIFRFSCRGCRQRFASYPWQAPFLAYARCPRCASVTLRDWEEEYHLPPIHKRALLIVGGKQQRCGLCRYNFVSFRPRWIPGRQNGD